MYLLRKIALLGKIALLASALPVALVAGLLSKGRKCTPEGLALELEALANGDMSDWDQLECVPLNDPRLEAIRQEAIKIELPPRSTDKAMLAMLAQRASALSSPQPSR